MNDRELLEKAAKAAGIEVEWDDEEFADLRAVAEGMFLKGKRSPDNSKYWNPLTDDGDALRLAVKMRIDIAHFSNFVRVDVDGHDDCHESNGEDACAALRRAIVRSAASVGEAMP